MSKPRSYSEVIAEIAVEGGWKRIGGVCEMEPPSSFSSDAPDGRQVYIFGWYNGDGPGLWRSVAGLDVESEVIREVHSVSLEKVADLSTSVHSVDFWRGSDVKTIRFRAVKG